MAPAPASRAPTAPGLTLDVCPLKRAGSRPFLSSRHEGRCGRMFDYDGQSKVKAPDGSASAEHMVSAIKK